MVIHPLEILLLCIIGLAAGMLGGMLGVGGSIIMIPAMAILFVGRDWHDQHLFQAAAMLVNVAVAIPAARRHLRSGAFRRDLFAGMLPATLVFICIGVVLSDWLPGRVLQQLFAVFLLYVSANLIHKAIGRDAPLEPTDERVTRLRSGFVGSVMGFLAGLLGIGGGGIAVPLAHVVCRLPLRSCIAVSAAVMSITAGVGAALKIALLDRDEHALAEPFVLFLCLAPMAIVGSHLGAGLTHRVPVRVLRCILAATLLAAAGRMLLTGGAPDASENLDAARTQRTTAPDRRPMLPERNNPVQRNAVPVEGVGTNDDQRPQRSPERRER